MVIQKKIAQLRRLRKINDALLAKKRTDAYKWVKTFSLDWIFLSTGHEDLDDTAITCSECNFLQSLIIQHSVFNLKMSVAHHLIILFLDIATHISKHEAPSN